MTNALDDTAKTYDYEAALEAYTSAKNDRGIALAYVLHDETIRHALSEMQRMKTEGLVIVPREPTKAMLDAVRPHFINESDSIVSEWKAMIAAQITGDEK